MSSLKTQGGAVSVGRDDDNTVSEGDSDILGASNDGVVFSLLKEAATQGKVVEIGKQWVETYREEAETCRKEMETNGKEVHTQKDVVGSRGNIGDTQQHAEHVTPCGQESVNKAECSNSWKESDLTIAAAGRAKVVDNWTQTEEEYFDTTPSALLPQVHNTLSSNTDQRSQTGTSSPPVQTQPNRLPHVESTQAKVANETTFSSASEEKLQRYQPTPKLPGPPKFDASQLVKFPLAKRPLSSIVDSLPAYNPATNSGHTRHYSADTAIFSKNSHHVHTTEATRRLMGLYNGFNRTEVLQRFHEQYPENAPDLREYSIREGRRHIIHGSHAYYFH